LIGVAHAVFIRSKKRAVTVTFSGQKFGPQKKNSDRSISQRKYPTKTEEETPGSKRKPAHPGKQAPDIDKREKAVNVQKEEETYSIPYSTRAGGGRGTYKRRCWEGDRRREVSSLWKKRRGEKITKRKGAKKFQFVKEWQNRLVEKGVWQAMKKRGPQ